MLHLILGKAGTGKTTAVMEAIRRAVEEKRGGQLLLVPEQYSHEAERELCAVCGDSLSLYGEVFSFTGLARRLMSEQGGGAVTWLDKGGRLLCMALALRQVGSRLRVYTAAQRKADMQAMLLRQLDELKTACVTPERLEQAAALAGDSLGDKLYDLSLLGAAYDAVVSNGHADPADRLSVLAAQIPESRLGPESAVYVDGFLDFTYQEQAVLRALLQKGVSLTVCLTVDALDSVNELYALSRLSARRLIAEAEALGVKYDVRYPEAQAGKSPALRWFSEELFRYGAAVCPTEERPVRLLLAESVTAECEAAAAQVLALVRDGGCRWRDIAIAIRGFEDYRAALESVFSHYGIPLFVTRRSELLSKPLPALVSLAYELCGSGWEVDDVISCLRTGLTGLDTEECDRLADYVFKWQLRGWAWARPEDWRQHPDGYGAVYDEAAEERLREINRLRRRFAAPLLRFAERTEGSCSAREHCAALAALLADWRLPEQLEARAGALEAEGQAELSAEYSQLWELLVAALEQCAAILGEDAMDRESFGLLFTRMLSQYDIGLIPVSLDRVSAGDFDRMRRRRIRHLLVLGCSDDRIPRTSERSGVFDADERERLLSFDIDLGGGDGELWREFSLLYATLTLPSESLYLSCPVCGADGEALRPAFVFNRAAALFRLAPEFADVDEARLSAEAPALTLAAHAVKGGSARAAAAAAWFRAREPERFHRLEAAAGMSRGRLSPRGVEALYGPRLRLSASRIDRFASCRYAYFCQYGLRARPYEPAGFTPPEIGTFMHYVLEQTAREARDRGGFLALDDETLHAMTDRYVQEYVHTELNDFHEKSKRFIHLFKRLCLDVHQVVLDMAQELRRSDFEPLDFELDFSRASDIRPLELGEDEGAMTLTGVADRVDGWVHEGKLYLRVVDYKTGRKSFSLSDVWYGMGLQMLLYLFALENDGAGRYGRPIVPAGVMYIPARNALLSLTADVDDEQAEKKRCDALRRSGLALDDPALLEAWEKGEDKRYIPVKFKARTAPDGVASLEQLGLLSRHIRGCLTDMARELRRGSIAADPYYRSQQENACLNCDYFDACHFSEGENGEQSRFIPKLADARVWGRMNERWTSPAQPGETEADHG